MTELETMIDQEIGRETEQERVTYLKFLNLGRQMETEARNAQGQFSQAEMDAKVKAAQMALFEEMMAIDMEAGKLAVEVEAVDEDAKFQAMKLSPPEDMMAAFEALLTAVDEKHTAIMKEKMMKFMAIKDRLSAV